jgi:hypothetical protein
MMLHNAKSTIDEKNESRTKRDASRVPVNMSDSPTAAHVIIGVNLIVGSDSIHTCALLIH